MTDRLHFETRLEERLRARAALASRPFDAAAIARQAVAVNSRRRRIGKLEWPSMRPASRWLVVALLLAIALLCAVAGVGALMQERLPLPPAVVSNGWIASAANPWNFGGGHNGDIFLLEEGASPRRIIGSDSDGVAQECPAFSPDGTRLAYGEARASGQVTSFRGNWPVEDRAIVVVRLDEHGNASSPLIRIAVPGTGSVICPEWSPSSESLAFRAGNQLWIADSSSGASRVVPIMAATGQQENELEWSHDGSMVAVAEPAAIRLVAVDGDAPTIIGVDGATPRSLGWTAGDLRILYVSVMPVDEYGSAVRVVDVNGMTDTRLTPLATASDVFFSFDEAALSPDGLRVVYRQASTRCSGDGCGPGPSVEPIALAALDGSDPAELPIPAAANEAGSNGSDFFASGLNWSPDGQRVLLSSIDGVVAVGLEPGAPVVIYTTGKVAEGLNLEWSWSEVAWQPVLH